MSEPSPDTIHGDEPENEETYTYSEVHELLGRMQQEFNFAEYSLRVRHAALELAIQYQQATNNFQGVHTTVSEVAVTFENYIRNGSVRNDQQS